jgi:hypothetical protein
MMRPCFSLPWDLVMLSINRVPKLQWSVLFPIAMGLLAFLLVIGPSPLDPRNIAWLDGGYDPTQHYIGWAFFRSTPWMWPIGLSPNFGMEYSSSIVYSDSIPIFAFIFKLLSSWLSQPFQYFGIWYLACFILQAIFASLCVGLFIPKNRPLIMLCCVGILLFSPPMLWRIGLHAALAAHFTILASLYLIFRPYQKRNSLFWIILLDIISLIHLYLLAIVLALWIASLLDDLRLKKVSLYSFIAEISVVLISLVILLWQAGFFEISALSSTTGDYGDYSFGLLSFFDSQQWSYLIPSIPGGTLESFNYLGLGSIGLLLAIFFSKKVIINPLASFIKERIFLSFILLCLSFFAVSNTIRVAEFAFTIPLPQEIFSLASIFRASARMIWPLYYVLVLGVLYWIYQHFNSKTASILLLCACVIQIVDTSAGWTSMRRQFTDAPSNSGLKSPLKNPFWAQAARKYDEVINTSFPSGPPNLYVGWHIWANYASQYGLKTNSAWLSRYDSKQLIEAKNLLNEEIYRGVYRNTALYIVREELLIPISMHLDLKKDLLTRIDDFIVLAPGWKACTACMDVWSEELLLPTISTPKINQEIDFKKGSAGTLYLVGINQYQIRGSGWAFPESWGVWAEGDRAKLVLPLPQGGAKAIKLKMKGLTGHNRLYQRVKIIVNGVNLGDFSLASSEEILDLQIPKIINQDYVMIEFLLPDHISPKDLGVGDDVRLLSVGLISATFY